MKTGTVKKLALIALILIGAVFLLQILITVFQGPIKRVYGFLESSVIAFTYIPWEAFADSLVRLILTLVFFVSICRHREGEITKGLVITLAILWGIWSAVLSPVFSSLTSMLLNRFYGYEALASYSAVRSALSTYTVIPSTAAGILMLLALGGYYRSGEKASETSEA